MLEKKQNDKIRKKKKEPWCDTTFLKAILLVYYLGGYIQAIPFEIQQNPSMFYILYLSYTNFKIVVIFIELERWLFRILQINSTCTLFNY